MRTILIKTRDFVHKRSFFSTTLKSYPHSTAFMQWGINVYSVKKLRIGKQYPMRFFVFKRNFLLNEPAENDVQGVGIIQPPHNHRFVEKGVQAVRRNERKHRNHTANDK